MAAVLDLVLEADDDGGDKQSAVSRASSSWRSSGRSAWSWCTVCWWKKVYSWKVPCAAVECIACGAAGRMWRWLGHACVVDTFSRGESSRQCCAQTEAADGAAGSLAHGRISRVAVCCAARCAAVCVLCAALMAVCVGAVQLMVVGQLVLAVHVGLQE